MNNIIPDIQMICTQRIESTTDKATPLEGFETINVLKWKNSKWAELSPYAMRTDGHEEHVNRGGVLFENFWQGLKVYDVVHDIEIYPSRFHRTPEYLQWKYVSFSGTGSDVLLTDAGSDGSVDLDIIVYERWRDSLMYEAIGPVRYPNGYGNRRKCQFSRLVKENGEVERLGYIDARKRIYVQEYSRLARKTKSYGILLDKLVKGKNLLICEVDLPRLGARGEYGKDCDAAGNCAMTLEKIDALLNDPSESCGHGLVLAKCLLEDLASLAKH